MDKIKLLLVEDDVVDQNAFLRFVRIDNVIQRKWIANALEESEDKFRAVAETALDGIVTADQEGNIVYMNRSAEKMFDWSLGEVNKKPLILAARTLEMAGRFLYKLRMPGRGDESNLEGVTKPSVIPSTDLRAHLFDLIMEAMPCGNVLVNSAGIIFHANQLVSRVFGYTKEELIGQPLEKIIPPRFRKDHPKFRFDYFLKPQTRAMGAGRELYALRKDGTEFPVEIGLNPIVTEDETFVLATVVDISERKGFEKSLSEKAEALEKSNQELESFATTVAHDLKAPLRGVAQVADSLYEHCFDKAAREEKEYLIHMKRKVEHLNSLVEGILKVARMGARSLEKERVPVQEVLKDAVDSLKIPAPIKVKGDPNLPCVLFSRIQLEQVFLNLIENSVHAIGSNEGEIKVSFSENDSDWIFSVWDNGIGIDKENFERIFEMFQTIPSEGKESTGIGLNIVKRIVELNGGKVWVESAPGCGATFYFTVLKRT